MAHLHKKIKKGRPYYYIREIQRVNGKPKVVSQLYLGSAETIARRFREVEQARQPLRLQSRAFGALFVLHELEKELDTIGLIDGIVGRAPREQGPTVGEYFFYAWLNRLIAPRSKRALADWPGRYIPMTTWSIPRHSTGTTRLCAVPAWLRSRNAFENSNARREWKPVG